MQIFIFITCMFCGIVSGIFYDILYLARSFVCGINIRAYTLKDKIFLIACDILYFIVFAAGFIFVSVMFGFNSLRLYMLLGCALGALLYLKSFHIIVAFFVKKAYNKFSTFKEKNVERRKAQSHNGRNNGKRNNINLHSRRRRNLSNGGNRPRRVAKGGNSLRNPKT